MHAIVDILVPELNPGDIVVMDNLGSHKSMAVQAAIAAGFRPIRITVAGATGDEHPTLAAFDGTTAVVEVANTLANHYRHYPSPYASMQPPSGGFERASIRPRRRP